MRAGRRSSARLTLRYIPEISSDDAAGPSPVALRASATHLVGTGGGEIVEQTQRGALVAHRIEHHAVQHLADRASLPASTNGFGSGFSSGPKASCRPSAIITSAATRLSQAKPKQPPSQPWLPPSAAPGNASVGV